jgi:ketosteroid isomerase-like protein
MTLAVDAIEFSRIWEAAWNRRDVETVLAHFAEDAIFTSPVAQRVGFARDGVVRGKDSLRRYWLAALEKNPDLRFRVTAVYRGIDVIVIAFQNQHGVDRVEILRFANGLVVEGHGAFIAS